MRNWYVHPGRGEYATVEALMAFFDFYRKLFPQRKRQNAAYLANVSQSS